VNQILSQDEVDALLSAVDRGEIAEPSTPVAEPAGPQRTVIRYNFRKPNRVSKDQLKMLQSIHDTFARLYTSSLTTMLRGLVEVELKSVEQISYGEFIMSLAPPTCLSIFHMEPLKGGAALEISAEILFRLIDRLLGGSGLLPVRLREFTEVEVALIERIAMRAMLDLRQAWQHVGTFGFRVANLETNPQFVQLTAPNEVVIVVTFDIKVGDAEGQISIAFPHLLLESVMPKLNTHRWFATAQRATSFAEREGLQTNMLRVGLTVRGVLPDCPLTVGELLELKAGDVVKLGWREDMPAIVELEGLPRFTAKLGTVRRHKALQLLAVLPKGETSHEPGRSGSDRLPTS
jgi:flagellar motor switch protein FliM